MNRKVLIGVTVAWAVLVGLIAAVVLAMATFSGTSLSASSTASGSSGPVYRWDGKPMMITSAQRNKTAVCKVVPDHGEPRDVTSYRAQSRYGVNEITPWFSGSAKMTCTTNVTIRTGGQLKMYEQVTKNRLLQIVVVVIAVAPFLVVAVFGLGTRRNRV